jgi:hypothetical protein
MVAQRLKIGAQSRFYVGMFGSSDVLTSIKVLKTGGNDLLDDTPNENVPGINSYEQSDLRTVSLTATFYSDTGLVWNLAKKQTLGASANSASIPNSQYVIFIADQTVSSYILPQVSVISATNLKYDKGVCVQARITFEFKHRNPAYAPPGFDNLLVQGTLEECSAALGVRSPY